MILKIKELREEFAMTQTALAQKIGTTQRNVSNWENGTSEPDCETIVKIANLFEVSIDELFGRDMVEKNLKYSGIDRQLISVFLGLTESRSFRFCNFCGKWQPVRIEIWLFTKPEIYSIIAL